MAVIAKMPSINEPNFMFRNSRRTGGPLNFTNETTTWGFDEPTQSNGAVYADLDNDGDLDLVINNVNAEAGIYENHADRMSQNHHLSYSPEKSESGATDGGTGEFWAGGACRCRSLCPCGASSRPCTGRCCLAWERRHKPTRCWFAGPMGKRSSCQAAPHGARLVN